MAVTWEDRRKLMRDYFDELQVIENKPLLSDKQQDTLFARHVKEVQDGYGAWIDINCEDKLVGFLIVVQAPNCHPDADYFVEQAYIIPSHRKHGVMSSVVDSFVQEQPENIACSYSKGMVKRRNFGMTLLRVPDIRPAICVMSGQHMLASSSMGMRSQLSHKDLANCRAS